MNTQKITMKKVQKNQKTLQILFYNTINVEIGYPNGTEGEEIYLESTIIALEKVFRGM